MDKFRDAANQISKDISWSGKSRKSKRIIIKKLIEYFEFCESTIYLP